MKKHLTKNIIIFILSSVLISSLPILFISPLKDALVVGASLLSGFSGAGLLLLAILVYKDIIGKDILGKNVNVVLELIEKIKTMRLQIGFFTQNNLTLFIPANVIKIDSQSQFDWRLDPLESGNENYIAVFRLNNVFSELGTLERLYNSIYIPKELKGKFSSLDPGPMVIVPSNESINVARIAINDIIYLDDPSEQWYKFVGNEMTLFQFYSALQQCLIDLRHWLQSNSTSQIYLNL